jgi:hypothetical protein
MNFIYERIENGVKKNKYNDTRMRKIFINFAIKTLNLKFINGTELGIDLVCADDPKWGAEGENASWRGDRWKSDQIDIFNLGFNTLNLQNRKWFYFGLGKLSKKNIKLKHIITHEGFEKNLYFRMNKDEDQIIIVDSEVIRNLNIVHILYDRTVSNAFGPEDWVCIPQEFCRTYNKQPNGDWVLNGPYCGPSPEEIQKELEEEQRQKEEKEKNRLKELAIERKYRNLLK